MRYKNFRFTKTRLAAALFGLAITLQTVVPLLVPSASAGTLTNTLVRFDRLSQAVATTGTVCAKPVTVGVESSVAVTFPTGFTVSTTVGNWTTNTTSSGYGWPTGGTAWLTPGGAGSIGSASASTAVGQVVTWTSSDLTVGTLYCFNWTTTTGLTSVGTAGDYTGTVATNLDTGTYGVTTVGVGNDQITVSATINPTFSMTLSAFTDNLGILTSGLVSVSPTPRTATVSTNAPNGWYLWGKDSNQGLNSVSASYTVPSVVTCSSGSSSNSTLAAGTEGYNLGAVATSGTESIAATFVGGSAGRGGGLCNSAGYQTVASSANTANASVVTLTNNAAISGTTKPGADYTDLETFVGAGLF
jgi:hypothetical protein